MNEIEIFSFVISSNMFFAGLFFSSVFELGYEAEFKRFAFTVPALEILYCLPVAV